MKEGKILMESEFKDIKGGMVPDDTINVFNSIAAMPDLLKNYLFQVYFESKDMSKEDSEKWMLRIKGFVKQAGRIILTADEFQDLFVLKHEDQLKKVKKIKIKFFSSDLKECVGEMEYLVKYDFLQYSMNMEGDSKVTPVLYFYN